MMYNAAVGHCYDNILRAIEWSQGGPDIAYQLAKNPRAREWTSRGFRVWKEWRITSIQKLNNNSVKYVALADISAFYENIDIDKLIADLRSIGVNQDAYTWIQIALHRWAQPRQKGIPQGYSASDILAKRYMNSIDQRLRNAGFDHLRYVDDIRIFCSSEIEARRSLLLLTEWLRQKGLNLQSAKTSIENVEAARNIIDGVAPIIENIQDNLREELRKFAEDVAPYATIQEIENYVTKHPGSSSLAALEKAFRDYFLNGSDIGFNKTLFHYLLTRLGKTKSSIAVTYCLRLLKTAPEETEYILRYFNNVGVNWCEIDQIMSYIEGGSALFKHQVYEILSWLYANGYVNHRLLQFCRESFDDQNKPIWIPEICYFCMGEYGNDADKDAIIAEFDKLHTDEERAAIVYALRNTETGKRNAFYGRIKEEGDLVQRAINLAKQT